MIPKIQACKTAEYVSEIMAGKRQSMIPKIQACKTAEYVSEIMAGENGRRYEFDMVSIGKRQSMNSNMVV